MRRVVSLFLPHWPTDRIRRRNGAPSRDVPLATVGRAGQRRVLLSVDETAMACGLRPGMTVAHAQPLLPDLMLADAEPEADADALFRLAGWCLRYSPLVAPDPPDGVIIDIAGAAHLFGGEEALVADLRRRLRNTGVAAEAAVADMSGCAWAVARFGGDSIVPPGGAAAALAPLPLEALRLPAEAVTALQEVGIDCIGHLFDKPRATIRNRFAAEVLLHLDRALGRANEPLAALIPHDMPAVRRNFAEPVADPEDLKRIITALSGDLCGVLDQGQLGARRLDLLFHGVEGRIQAVCIGLSQPTRDARHFARLLEQRLDLVEPGFGFDAMTLLASRAERLGASQIDGPLAGAAIAAADLARLVDTLRVRLDRARIYRQEPVESEIPERSIRQVPPLAESAGRDWPSDLPRPARLLARPEPVTAMAELPDHPPLFFVWRHVRHRVVHADGPERIHGEWWVADTEMDALRDYYRVETADGGRFWLFRDASVADGGRWWLHGLGEA